MSSTLLSVEQLCDALNSSRSTVQRMIRNNQISTFTIGRRRFATQEAVDAFVRDRVDACKKPPGQEHVVHE